MKKKAVLSLFFTAVILLTLTACGGTIEGNEKTVTDKSVTVTIVEDGERIDVEGNYTGEVKNGKPDGHGEWTRETEDIAIKYVGEFSDGQLNGYGTLTITSDGESFDREGNYTNGEYTPTAGQLFNCTGQADVFGTYRLSAEQIEYIDAHKELFPTCERATADATELQNFSYKQFTKTRSQEEIGLVKLKLTAQQVFEDDFLGGKLTSVLAWDADYNYYALHYYDSVDIYDGDKFTAYALPCATSSFDNVGGGTTLVVVLLACYMG